MINSTLTPIYSPANQEIALDLIPRLLLRLREELESALSRDFDRPLGSNGRVVCFSDETSMLMTSIHLKLPNTRLHLIICSKSLVGSNEKLSEMVLTTPSGKLYSWSGETTEKEEKIKLAARVTSRLDLPADHQCSFALMAKYPGATPEEWSVFTGPALALLHQVFDRTWIEIMETGVLQENTKSVEKSRPRARI